MNRFEFEMNLGTLVPYTRKFATLQSSGVSLMRTLNLLQEVTDDPTLAEANAYVMKLIENGSTLWRAMAKRPEVFSPTYTAFVHTGEVGGILDETLNELANWPVRASTTQAGGR